MGADDKVGNDVGEKLGATLIDGPTLGRLEGLELGTPDTEGFSVGINDTDGNTVFVGVSVGTSVGFNDGLLEEVGNSVGPLVGAFERLGE